MSNKPVGLVDTVVLLVEVETGAVTMGIVEAVDSVGATEPPAVTGNGETLGVGIVAQGLTPRLAISQEPSGIPILGLPPGVVGVVDVGVDADVARPLEPGLHIPDTPTAALALVVDIPEIGNVPGSVGAATGVEIPAACALPDVAVVLVIVVPAVAAVVVAADPIAIPPPS